MSQPYGQQQPTYPGPPQYQPQQMNSYGYSPISPPPPPKKNRTRLIATLAFAALVVLVIGAVAVVAANRAAENAAYDAITRTGTVGSTVRDGDLSFTVTKVERTDRVGSATLGKSAQGEFVIVHLRVLNLGEKEERFTSTSQKLVDSTGRQFKPSTSAAIYTEDSGSKLLFERIGPGNYVKGVLVFDVPKGASVTLELRNSTISEGVKVTIP